MDHGAYPALVLNADYRPLSYHPLSIMDWPHALRAVFAGRVQAVGHYDQVARSPSLTVPLPSVVVLRRYIGLSRQPLLTRHNLFLRDGYCCQYCRQPFSARDLTLDHVVPRRLGGRTRWENLVACCGGCNIKKGGRTPGQAHMTLAHTPRRPSNQALFRALRRLPHLRPHRAQWDDFLSQAPASSPNRRARVMA
ncbi:MAG: HNH endonuclease [Pseudomonadota bacterium]